MANARKEQRMRILEKFGSKCAYCGKELTYKTLTVDHFLPRAKAHYLNSQRMMQMLPEQHHGIEHIEHEDNLYPSCRRCNSWKGTFDIEKFRREIAAQTKRLREYKAGFRMAEDFGLIECRQVEVVFWFEVYGEWEELSRDFELDEEEV